jgi:hypothetical protein
LDQVNLCWLYCPDTVIYRANAFLATVKTDVKQPDQAEQQKALGEFIVALRKDLFSRRVAKKTDLNADDFKHLTAN